MKLDKKIKIFNVLTPFFPKEKYKSLEGKECYFANDITDYCDLKTCIKDKLIIRETEYEQYPFCTEEHARYKFCLPCKYVEEELEGFRPLTIEDFEDNEPLDEWVRMRRKADGNVYNLRFNGYFTFASECCICLGSFYYKSTDLFDMYELYRDGKYVVFGVEK